MNRRGFFGLLAGAAAAPLAFMAASKIAPRGQVITCPSPIGGIATVVKVDKDHWVITGNHGTLLELMDQRIRAAERKFADQLAAGIYGA